MHLVEDVLLLSLLLAQSHVHCCKWPSIVLPQPLVTACLMDQTMCLGRAQYDSC